VLSDSSDDEVETTSKKPSKQEVERKKEISEPKVEETTSTDYFASSGKTKPSRSTPLRPKSTATSNGTSTKTPTKAVNGSAPSSGRKSARKKPSKSYAETDSDDVAAIMKDDDEGGDDIYAQDFKTNGRLAGDDYAETSSDDSVPNPVTKSTRIAKNPAREKATAMSNDNDVDVTDVAAFDGPGDPKRNRGITSTTTKPERKRKSKAVEDDEEDDFEGDNDDGPKRKAKKSTASPAAKKPRTATKKKEEKEESKEIQAIFDTIPTVRAPTPPPRDEKKKFTYGGGNTSVVPAGAGTKVIPEGAENCLAGLAFVFTGVLDTLGREEGQNLVKRYGGKVTTGPSSKTSYVVLGNEAGPKKLETIAKLKLKTINEDGLFELIKRLPANGGDSLAAEKHAEKKAKEEKKIEEAAAEMEKKDMAVAEAAAKAKSSLTSAGAAKSASQASNSAKPIDGRLWTDKYAPDSMQAVIGNKGLVEKLQSWLRSWHKNAHYDFKRAGADGSGIYRAAMLHGPPGIGKTTAAHLIAKLEGYDIVESNASDTRSKRMVEDGLRGVLDTTSLLGFFAADGQKVQAGKKKLVLIMDEVDGMSAGDRGGVGALAAVAKKTNIPMILICNERRLPKMKPFDHVTLDLPFRRPTVEQIRARIMTICFREGLKIQVPVLNALVEGTHADIRQIINMISTAKLDHQAMDFDGGQRMSKAWEKNVILKPWDIVSKILRPQMFAASSTATLNDKIELYFNDHELSHLMLQESYLKTQPARATNYSGKERSLKLLEIADNAAHSISNGDLVDRMIHGTQQQWSLMPAHAIFSFVDPASQVYGNFNERVSFPSWLGQNSKYGMLTSTSRFQPR
jgi:replication factor C subunit 1